MTEEATGSGGEGSTQLSSLLAEPVEREILTVLVEMAGSERTLRRSANGPISASKPSTTKSTHWRTPVWCALRTSSVTVRCTMSNELPSLMDCVRS